MRKRVALVALDGVLDSAFGVTVDILAVANRVAKARGAEELFEAQIVTAGESARSSSGRQLRGDATFRTRSKYDVVIVLGMNVPLREELERALERDDVRGAQRFIVRQAQSNAVVCASCAGTFVLAETGLLEDRSATTSWWLAPVFRSRYPRIELSDDTVVVTNRGQLVTGGAALSQIDLMLWLMRRFAGPEIATLCARLLVVDERPTQARYAMVQFLAHDSEEIRRAERFIRRNLNRPLSIAEIARAASVSTRTLTRRVQLSLGMSPLRFVQRLRVEQAAHLLGTTQLAFDEVARRVGYEDPGALRGLLRRELGVTARGLRPAKRVSETDRGLAAATT